MDFFSYLWVLYLLTFLIVLAKTSCTMLNRKGKNRYPYLVPDFNFKALGFSSFNMMWLELWPYILDSPRLLS